MAYVYSTEEFEKISAMYQSGQSLEDIQSLFPDKSVASIRMKLVKAGIYQKQTKTAATVKATTSKAPAEPRPTTKAEILAAFKRAHGYVGDATL